VLGIYVLTGIFEKAYLGLYCVHLFSVMVDISQWSFQVLACHCWHCLITANKQLITLVTRKLAECTGDAKKE